MASRSAELIIKVVAQVQDAVSGIDKLASKASGLGGKMSGAVSKGVNAVATATATVIGLTAAATAGVIAQGVSYNVLNQRARAAFTTVLGSAAAADKMLSDLQKFASTSPFPRQAFIQATQQMLAFGFASADVIPTLDAVQNAVAAAGGSSDDILEIVDVLSKVKSSGKFTAETLNQLGFRGVDAAKIIGESMGKTGAQIRESITKGTLDSDAAITALTKGMAKKFAGAADGLKGTWVGAVDRIKGATRDLGSALVEPFISKAGGGYAVVWANQLADLLRQLEADVGPLIEGMLSKLTPVFDAITKAMGNIDLASIFDKASSALEGLAPLIVPLVAGLGALGGANIAAALGPLGQLLPAVSGPMGAVVVAIAALVAVMPGLRSAFTKILPILADLAKTVGGTLGKAFQQAMPAIQELGTVLGTVVVAAVKALAPMFAQLVKTLAPLLPIVAKVAAAIASFLGPALVSMIGVVGTVMTWLLKLPGPLKAIAVGIGIATAAIWLFNAAMAANPVTLVIIGIVALIAIIVACWKRFDGFRAVVLGTWAAISTGASAVWNAIKVAFDAILGAITATFNWVKSNWPLLLAIITGPIGLAVYVIAKNFNAIKAAAKAVWDAIKSGAKAVGSAVRSIFTAAFSAVANIVRSYIAVVRAVLNTIRTVVQAVTSYIRSAFGAAWSFVRSAASGPINAVKTVIRSIREVVATVTSFIREKFSAAWSAVSKAATSALQPVRSAIDGIKSAIGYVIDAVHNLINALGNIKVPKISLPKIPGLSAMATVPAPAVPNSGNRAAARSMAPGLSTPASRGAQAGGTTNVFNITGASDPEAVARQIRRVMSGHEVRMGLVS